MNAPSKDEIVQKMKDWMVLHFGSPSDYANEPDQRDKWYRDYGLLYHFICDNFQDEESEPQIQEQ